MACTDQAARPLIAVLCNVEGYAKGSEGAAQALAGLRPGEDKWAYKQGIGACYLDAVAAAGGAPVLMPCLPDADLLGAMLARVDGLLIPGGADIAPADYGAEPSPALGHVNCYRDAADRALIAFALAHPELPVLGICRGIQAYNAYAGGDLVQDIPSEVPGHLTHRKAADGDPDPYHDVEIAGGDSKLAAILGEGVARVNSFHHQAAKTAAPGLAVVARTADGVIEAMERPEARWTVLVQWHPEHMFRDDEGARRLFEAFVAACR